MTSKNWQKIFFIFSITIFIISLIIFVYSIANKKYSTKLELENNNLKSQIKEIEEKSKIIKENISSIEVDLNLKSQEFYERYGYQFESNKSDEINKLVDNLKEENNNIVLEIKSEIKSYENYYNSNIYDKEGYDKSVDYFLNLQEGTNVDKINNIYNELEIDSLISESNGFIENIISNNNESLDLKILLYYASIYAYEIYNFEINNSTSVLEVLVNLYNLKNIYSEIERKNFNTGNLNSRKMDYLVDFVSKKVEKYYENQGIIKSLEKGGNNES